MSTGRGSTLRLRFGVGLLSSNLREVAEQARLADELGFDLVRVIDSQSLFPDCYVALTLAALNTKRALIGPAVTNPVTRHPAVTAGAIASLDELSGGRAFLGIGTGDSAVRNIGEQPASTQMLREYVLAVRELFRRRETVYRGKPIRLTWAKREVPIWIGATGPNNLRLAGELGDVAILGSGFWPERIQADLPYVAEGARVAGRGLADVELWVFGPGNAADTWQGAVDPLLAALADRGRHALGRPLPGGAAPPELVPALQRLAQEYRPHAHQGGADSVNGRLVAELGLTSFLASRFALAGTPEQCIAQARAVAATGVRGFMLTIVTPNALETIRTIGERVLPAFR